MTPYDVPSVAVIHKTRDVHVIVKVRRTQEGAALADQLCGVFSVDLGHLTDPVASLGCSTDVEDDDLDPVATEDDILTAIGAAAFETVKDAAGVASIRITEI